MPRTGRPKGSGSLYTPELAADICSRISRGESLNAICELPGMPAAPTVCLWVNQRPDFAEQYARAREARADFWADQVIQISDDGTNDTYRANDGSLKVQHDHIQRSRLRVDTRKWLMARMNPKKYGEFQRTEVTGADGGPVRIEVNVNLKKLPDADG